MPLARLAFLAAVTAALVPISVMAAIPRPVPIKPKPNATLAVGKTPWFKVRSTGRGTVWVHVSKSAKRGADGVIGDDAVIAQAHRKGRFFVVRPQSFDYPGFWAKQRKKWYWQPYRIACGEERRAHDCKVEGRVRSFRLE
jgi:hypothetical protein